MNVRKQTVGALAAIALAFVGSVTLLDARDRFHLVNINTAQEETAGKAVWIVTLTILLVAATALGFWLAPSPVAPYAVAAVAVTAAAVPAGQLSETLAFLCGLLGPFTAVTAGALAARSGRIDDRGAGYVAFGVSGWLFGSGILFVFTWAYAFFE